MPTPTPQAGPAAASPVKLPEDTRIVAEQAPVTTSYRRSEQEGGTGGDPFADDLTEVCRLVTVRIRSGSRIDAITAVWRMADGSTRPGRQHGGSGGTEQQFSLDADEYINRIEGRSGAEVDQLTFFTSKGRRYGPYGGNGGLPFEITGGPVNGFFGRSGSRVDAIGGFTLSQCG